MAVIATLSGTGLRPGISKNRRYYSPELIGKAVQRAQARLADEAGRPLTMRVAHPDPDTQQFAPVTETAGRLTGVNRAADGSLRFTADIYDTQAGRDVLALYDTRGGQRPALKNVSIRGRWLGDVTAALVDGVQCEAGEDLELDGIDFTHLPGVDGAEVDQVADPGAALESAGAGAPIYESCEEMHVTETATEAPAAKPYADLGYLPDGQQCLPLSTLSEARAAWAALNEAKTADRYTSKQLKRVRERTAKALRGFGVEVRRDLAEGAGAVLVQRGQVAEGAGFDPFTAPGEFYVRLDNGAVSITVSSCSIDPHDLGRIGTAAMSGAVQALLVMDPDDDGDIDVPGAPFQDADHGVEGEAAPVGVPAAGDVAKQDEDDTEAAEESAAAPAETAPSATDTPASTEDAANTNTTESEAPVMADAPQAAAEATPATDTPAPGAAPLTMEALNASLAAFGTALVEGLASKLAPQAAPAEPATEAAPAAAEVAEVVETEAERVDRLVSEALAKRNVDLQTAVASGRIQPARKGLVGKVNESGTLETVAEAGADGINEHGLPTKWAGSKAPHELTGNARNILSGLAFEHVLGHRGARM